MPMVGINNHPIAEFYVLLTIISIPFWILGYLGEPLAERMPAHLPTSAFMFVNPCIIAICLVYRQETMHGVTKLFYKIFQVQKMQNVLWCSFALFIMPIILWISYVILKKSGKKIPALNCSFQVELINFVLFFISALGEEIGWMGYLVDIMLSKWSIATTGLVMGVQWATWHNIPFLQTHHSTEWIIWQCLFTVAFRVILIWLYVHTNKSILAVILCHSTYNLAFSIFPNNGSHYNPLVVGIPTIILATTVILVPM